MNKVSILYDRVLRLRKILVNKSDKVWNINLNLQARSMKGLLLLFEDMTSGGLAYARDTEQYYNLKITKIDVIVEGCPNQIYSQGLRSYHSYHTWEEAKNCSPAALAAIKETLK